VNGIVADSIDPKQIPGVGLASCVQDTIRRVTLGAAALEAVVTPQTLKLAE